MEEWVSSCHKPFTWSIPFSFFHLLFFIATLNWWHLVLIRVSFACLTLNRCCLGAGNLWIHFCVITLCHVINMSERDVWVSHDCSPAPLPRGTRVRHQHKGIVHVQIDDAKRATVTKSSCMCLTCLDLLLGTGSVKPVCISLELPHLCCGVKDSLPKSVLIHL